MCSQGEVRGLGWSNESLTTSKVLNSCLSQQCFDGVEAGHLFLQNLTASFISVSSTEY